MQHTETCRRVMSGVYARFAPALLALALGACGGDAPAGAGEPDDGYETFSGGPPGGVLVVLADREPDNLNPLTFDSYPASQAVHLMFRALGQRDTTLSDYKPDLATSWQLQPDSTLVLRLRTDAHWHDGEPVTAEDVVFTIERQMDPRTASPRQGDLAPVTQVVALDSATVAVRLSQSGPYTVNAILDVVPVPKHLLDGVAPDQMQTAPFGRSPVGNGFFRFSRWDAGQQLVMDVNRDMPEGRAALDRVVMRFIPDLNSAMTELLSGQADLLKIPADHKDRVEAAPDVELHSAPRIRPAWIAWNTRTPPLDDARVRRALLMGIDRRALAEGLFGDVGEPAFSPIPETLREHSETVRPIPHDPAAARRLLTEAGWRDVDGDGIREKDGQPLSLQVDYISTDQPRADALVIVQNMLRDIGVDLAPRAYESTAWVERLRNREFTGSLWGWGYGPGVVGPNARMVFHSSSIPPGGPNFASYSNPRVDELIDRVLAVDDTAQARSIWMRIEQHLIDDAVYAPLYMDPELFGVHERFENVEFRGIEWWEDVPYWYVPADRRLPRERAAS